MSRRRSTTRRWIAAVGTAAMLLGALAASQAPAMAALSGATVVSEQSDFTSDGPKSAIAVCPPGKRVTGGGGRVDGVPGHVVVTRMRPVHLGDDVNFEDSFQISASEDETGTNDQWAVTAIAICADPIDGIEIVSSSEQGGDTVLEFAQATCPLGKTAIGSGGRISSTSGEVHLVQTGAPNPSSTRTVVQGLEDTSGFAGNWTLTAYAICVPTPAQGTFATAQATTSLSSASPQLPGPATCPAGMSVTGSAGAVFGGQSREPVLQAVDPEALAGGVPGNEVDMIARENNPIGTNWNARVIAFCHA
jgi:hypothetical protein